MLRWSWWLFGAAFFQISGNIMGCHRHPMLFWAKAGCLTLSENNTGCQWQPIIFPLISKSCAPYRYQDHLRIQYMKVSSWALNFQNPKPKTDPGSSTNNWYQCIYRTIQLLTKLQGNFPGFFSIFVLRHLVTGCISLISINPKWAVL